MQEFLRCDGLLKRRQYLWLTHDGHDMEVLSPTVSLNVLFQFAFSSSPFQGTCLCQSLSSLGCRQRDHADSSRGWIYQCQFSVGIHTLQLVAEPSDVDALNLLWKANACLSYEMLWGGMRWQCLRVSTQAAARDLSKDPRRYMQERSTASSNSSHQQLQSSASVTFEYSTATPAKASENASVACVQTGSRDIYKKSERRTHQWRLFCNQETNMMKWKFTRSLHFF